MDILNTTMGWMFAVIAALFTLGLTPRWTRAFYPTSPSFRRRLAAPALFLLLAAACFTGFTAQALAGTVILGLPLIVVRRWNEPGSRPEG